DHTPAHAVSPSGVATPVGIDNSPCSAPETSATPLSATVGTPAPIDRLHPVASVPCSAPAFVRYDVRACPTAAQLAYPRHTPRCDFSCTGASRSAQLSAPVR